MSGSSCRRLPMPLGLSLGQPFKPLSGTISSRSSRLAHFGDIFATKALYSIPSSRKMMRILVCCDNGTKRGCVTGSLRSFLNRPYAITIEGRASVAECCRGVAICAKGRRTRQCGIHVNRCRQPILPLTPFGRAELRSVAQTPKGFPRRRLMKRGCAHLRFAWRGCLHVRSISSSCFSQNKLDAFLEYPVRLANPLAPWRELIDKARLESTQISPNILVALGDNSARHWWNHHRLPVLLCWDGNCRKGSA
jgi:hypothetical protein